MSGSWQVLLSYERRDTAHMLLEYFSAFLIFLSKSLNYIDCHGNIKDIFLKNFF